VCVCVYMRERERESVCVCVAARAGTIHVATQGGHITAARVAPGILGQVTVKGVRVDEEGVCIIFIYERERETHVYI